MMTANTLQFKMRSLQLAVYVKSRFFIYCIITYIYTYILFSGNRLSYYKPCGQNGGHLCVQSITDEPYLHSAEH